MANDPYAALRVREFNIFLLPRFFLVFGWSMQFIVIEWQVYSLTKNPLSLALIGAFEFIPAFLWHLFLDILLTRKKNETFLLSVLLHFH